MPQETLALLDRDTERLLFAGAQVARSDADLEARRQKLAPLGSKAPALARVVEQVEKVQKARGKSAAGELLDLAVLMAQVRGAQASPAVARTEGGDLAPLPAGPPIESPRSPTELLALVNALTVRGEGRTRVLADAVKRGAVRDLRLLPLCVRALGDASIGRFVEQKLMPSLGRLVAPELRASLNVETGKAIDASKLRVLATLLDRAEIAPQLVAAIAKGAPEIRVVAVDLLANLDPAQAEPIALRLCAEDRSIDVRRAAVLTLGGGTSDAALDVLFDAFQNRHLETVAGIALARFNHPRATERALALLTPELLALRELKLPKADTKAKKAANEKLETALSNQVYFVSTVLKLLGGRKDELNTLEKVLEVFRDHRIKDVRNAAALALLTNGYEQAFDELAPTVVDGDFDIRDRFLSGVLARDLEHAFDRLGRFLDPAWLTGKNRVAFAEHILDALDHGAQDPEEDREDEDREKTAVRHRSELIRKDPRWFDAVIALVDHKDLMSSALDLLVNVKADRARDAVIARMTHETKGDNIGRLVAAIAPYRDPRVSPLLVRFLDIRDREGTRDSCFNALREHDDAAVVPLITAWAAGKKKLDKGEKEALEETLQFLSRDRSLA